MRLCWQLAHRWESLHGVGRMAVIARVPLPHSSDLKRYLGHSAISIRASVINLSVYARRQPIRPCRLALMLITGMLTARRSKGLF